MALLRGLLLFALVLPALADPPTPVEDLQVVDTPGDDGSSLLLTWKAMPYDSQPGVKYSVEAAPHGEALTEQVQIDANTTYADDVALPFWMWKRGTDRHAIEVKFVNGAQVSPFERNEKQEFKRGDDGQRIPRSYDFRVTTIAPDGRATSILFTATAQENWFAWKKLNNCALLLFFSGILYYFISTAKKGRTLFLRRIAGLDALEEAIGRATEMGRPLYYLTGLYGMEAIQTIASTVILGHVARRVAEYDSQLRVPHRDPVVLSVCHEVVKEAYLKAGRPDAFKDEFNFFLTQEQFSYTAAVDGMMVRERPAAVFYMGYFLAESLLLAEVGATTGAIQVAGTDVASQLPFFVTACDYTLIGEELYAASAYLSREPVLVGTLRGQDVGKLLTLGAVAAGAACALLNWTTLLDLVRVFQ